MSLHLDGIIFSLQAQGGISVYFRELVRRLQRDRTPATLSLYGRPMQAFDDEPRSPLRLVHRDARYFERYRRDPAPLEATLFHSSYYRLPARRGLPSVTTVYDFTYERHVRGLRQWVHSRHKRAAILASDALICISESTRRDLERFVPGVPGDRLHVVPLAVGDEFAPLGRAAAGGRPYLLFVGQRAGYKNFAAVAVALGQLTDVELRCAGGGPLSAQELEALPASVRPRIVHLGLVSNAQLNELYNGALCLVYPSSCEGFGIPVLEAMRAGCPVVCIACDAVLETGGDALTVAASADPGDLAAAIGRLQDDAYRESMVRAGAAVAGRFSWEQTYCRTLAVYRSLADLQ